MSALRERSVQVRLPHFDLASCSERHWLNGSAARTRFFDALSLLLPAGERFFIDALRDRLPALHGAPLADVRAFLGQEAWHSRVHVAYNDRLDAAGLPALRLAQFYSRRFARARTLLSADVQLATTVGGEHITSILAAWLLETPRVLDGANAEYAALWRWHSAEEIEHKDVTASVHRALGGGYWLRTWGMLIATFTIVSGVVWNWLVLLRRDGALFSARTWRDMFRLCFGADRLLASTLPRYFAFFSPRFSGLSLSANEQALPTLQALLNQGKLSLAPSKPR